LPVAIVTTYVLSVFLGKKWKDIDSEIDEEIDEMRMGYREEKDVMHI
jgi:hypothetical protein